MAPSRHAKQLLGDGDEHLLALADEVESTHGRVVITRPGHADVVLLSADELASLDESVFWMRDEADRAADGEAPGAGEVGPGIDAAELRRRYGHLMRRRDSA